MSSSQELSPAGMLNHLALAKNRSFAFPSNPQSFKWQQLESAYQETWPEIREKLREGHMVNEISDFRLSLSRYITEHAARSTVLASTRSEAYQELPRNKVIEKIVEQVTPMMSECLSSLIEDKSNDANKLDKPNKSNKTKKSNKSNMSNDKTVQSYQKIVQSTEALTKIHLNGRSLRDLIILHSEHPDKHGEALDEMAVSLHNINQALSELEDCEFLSLDYGRLACSPLAVLPVDGITVSSAVPQDDTAWENSSIALRQSAFHHGLIELADAWNDLMLCVNSTIDASTATQKSHKAIKTLSSMLETKLRSQDHMEQSIDVQNSGTSKRRWLKFGRKTSDSASTSILARARQRSQAATGTLVTPGEIYIQAPSIQYSQDFPEEADQTSTVS